MAAQDGRHAGGEHRLAALDQRRSRPRCERLGNDLAQGRADQLGFAGAACAGQSAEGAQAEVDALLADPRLVQGMLVRFGLAALPSVPFWQAPPLVYWQGQGVAQALFSSTLALWRRKGAFAVYALAWFAVEVPGARPGGCPAFAVARPTAGRPVLG
ncbi:MAG: hypothetical protein J0L57_18190 [Burkholderiales bacterium]|nr:hypothetical protein [Burkholderiales bacterium]